ncbi:hypothetical protein L207DRAFT_589989 [Hyaloscypha variabilis F]|jgi:hypothetical protein|uniref:Heterokaryon incompatibility domain-containing protein n=1 Tax=Hyaloscypha variabilis (strain UAMH 11265 / GT02V1 / F) TaxID=1149755 RepID=A0A2J6R335_HYAVF|nr:hypothetical protein L207DRAFT_589989 [Hyaloscypha variabilis F]
MFEAPISILKQRAWLPTSISITGFTKVAELPIACDTGDSARNNVRQRLYKPISEIEYRVVHLLPGRFLDEIQCVLETRSFGVKTRYEAISYQWGDTPNTKPVRMAYSTTHPSTPGVLTKALPDRAPQVLVKAYRVLEAAAKRYIVPL